MSDSVNLQLNPELQNQMKNEAIELVSRDNETITMREELCKIPAHLVWKLVDKNRYAQWMEFPQFLFQCANSPLTPLRENALIIFSHISHKFGNQENYLVDIKQMLAQSFADTEYSVRFNAGRALIKFISNHAKEESVLNQFSDLLVPYLKIIEESAIKAEDHTLITETRWTRSTFYQPQLDRFLQLCLNIGQDGQLSNKWRHSAIGCWIMAAQEFPDTVEEVGMQVLPQFVKLVSFSTINYIMKFCIEKYFCF
jgi:hypothetical protein